MRLWLLSAGTQASKPCQSAPRGLGRAHDELLATRAIWLAGGPRSGARRAMHLPSLWRNYA